MHEIIALDPGPTIRGLCVALDSGHSDALTTFWQRVAARGAPIVEADPEHAASSLVTFVWRAGEPVDNVVVMGTWGDMDVARDQLRRVDGTDCWYRTYRMPSALRFSYWFVPNDSLIPWRDMRGYQEYEARMSAMQSDPLNPHRWDLPEGDSGPAGSVVALPDAPAQPWSDERDGVASGSVREYPFHSDLLDNDRRVWVYTPPGYESTDGPVDLLVAFDGAYYGSVVPTPTILDNLQADGRIDTTVALLIDNAGSTDQEQTEARNRELPCNPAFADALAHEFVPWVRERFRVTRDPMHTTVAGSSFGGLAAAYVALCYPQIFGNVVSQSGAFQWKPGHDPFHPETGEELEDEWLAREYALAPAYQLQFYLDVGVFESRGLPGERPGILPANRHMRNVLQAKGYPVHYVEFCGGHDYACWRGTLADGLLAVRGRAGDQ